MTDEEKRQAALAEMSAAMRFFMRDAPLGEIEMVVASEAQVAADYRSGRSRFDAPWGARLTRQS